MNELLLKLKSGNEVTFVKDNGDIQKFKVVDDVLKEFKDNEWITRTYLPRWDDLTNGTWIL